MAQIEIRLARGYWVRRLILLFLSVSFGLYAAYDGFYKYPADTAKALKWERRQELLDRKENAGTGLTPSELDELQVLQTEFDAGGIIRQPKKYTQWDINVQFTFLGLSVLGFLIFSITWWLSARRKYQYHDDGTLVAPEGTFKPDRMTGIDLTRWQQKSIALLEIDGGPDKGGSGVKLDAWIYDGLEAVIETLDRRFHPEDYQKPTAAEPADTPADDAATGVKQRDPNESRDRASDEGDHDEQQQELLEADVDAAVEPTKPSSAPADGA